MVLADDLQVHFIHNELVVRFQVLNLLFVLLFKKTDFSRVFLLCSCIDLIFLRFDFLKLVLKRSVVQHQVLIVLALLAELLLKLILFLVKRLLQHHDLLFLLANFIELLAARA